MSRTRDYRITWHNKPVTVEALVTESADGCGPDRVQVYSMTHMAELDQRGQPTTRTHAAAVQTSEGATEMVAFEQFTVAERMELYRLVREAYARSVGVS